MYWPAPCARTYKHSLDRVVRMLKAAIDAYTHTGLARFSIILARNRGGGRLARFGETLADVLDRFIAPAHQLTVDLDERRRLPILAELLYIGGSVERTCMGQLSYVYTTHAQARTGHVLRCAAGAQVTYLGRVLHPGLEGVFWAAIVHVELDVLVRLGDLLPALLGILKVGAPSHPVHRDLHACG